MPGITVLELLKRIKQSFFELAVYMITAFRDEENRLKATEFGADYFITKPVKFDQLKEKIFALKN